MSCEKVKEYFDSVGLSERVVERAYIGDTVEHAARAIGCEPARIAKTMSFIQNGEPVLVVMAGDAKVNNTKYKACFFQKATMIPSNQVEALVGHVPGAICPFAINDNVHIYLDISLKRFDMVYTAGGGLSNTIQLSLDELGKHSKHSGWVDVCNGWDVNDNE